MDLAFTTSASTTQPTSAQGYYLGSYITGWSIHETAGGTARVYVLDGAVSAPGAATATLIADAGAGDIDAGAHLYKVTFVTAEGETEAGTASNGTTADATHQRVDLSAIPVGPTGTTARKIYRTEAGQGTYKLLATIADNTTTTLTDTAADSTLGATAPTLNTSGYKLWDVTLAANGTASVALPAPVELVLRNAARTRYLRAEIASGSVFVALYGR